MVTEKDVVYVCVRACDRYLSLLSYHSYRLEGPIFELSWGNAVFEGESYFAGGGGRRIGQLKEI